MSTYTVTIPGVGTRTISSDSELTPGQLKQYVAAVRATQSRAGSGQQMTGPQAPQGPNDLLAAGLEKYGFGPPSTGPEKPLQVVGQQPGPPPGTSPQEWAYQQSLTRTNAPSYDPSEDYATNYGQLPDPGLSGAMQSMARVQANRSPLRRASLAMGLPTAAIGAIGGAAGNELYKGLLQGFPGFKSTGLGSKEAQNTATKLGETATYAIPGLQEIQGLGGAGQLLSSAFENGIVPTVTGAFNAVDPRQATGVGDEINRLANLLLIAHGAKSGLKGASDFLNSDSGIGATAPNQRGFLNLPSGLANLIPGVDTSGMGARVADAFGSNLHYLESLDPDAAAMARQVPSAGNTARTAYGLAAQNVDAIGGAGSWEKLVKYLTQSNLQGGKERLGQLSSDVAGMDPDQFAHEFRNGTLAQVLDAIEAPQGDTPRATVRSQIDTLLGSMRPTQTAIDSNMGDLGALEDARGAAQIERAQRALEYGAAQSDHASASAELRDAQRAHDANLDQISRNGDDVTAALARWKELEAAHNAIPREKEVFASDADLRRAYEHALDSYGRLNDTLNDPGSTPDGMGINERIVSARSRFGDADQTFRDLLGQKDTVPINEGKLGDSFSKVSDAQKAYLDALEQHGSAIDFSRGSGNDLRDAAARESAAASAKEDALSALSEAEKGHSQAERAIQLAQARAVAGPNADASELSAIAKELASQALQGAANVQNDVMPAAEFAAMHADPKTAPMVQAYVDALGKYMQHAHLEHDGVLTTATGPAGAYIPLVRDPEAPGLVNRAGLSQPNMYGTPGNRANNFRTGAGNYTLDPELLLQRIGGQIRGSAKANLMDRLASQGILQPTDARLGTPDLTMTLNGREVPAEVHPIEQPLRALSGGRTVTIKPGSNALIPAQLHAELESLLGVAKKPGPLQRLLGPVASLANHAAVAGFAEPLAHGRNLAAISYSHGVPKTSSAANKLLAATPGFAAQLMHEIATVNFKDPATTADLVDIAKHGGLPTKTSLTLADNSPKAGIGKLHPRELVFGPHGLDVRMRLVMYRRLKALDPNIAPTDMARALDSLGTYTKGLNSDFERSLKDSGLAPFATAAKTMMKGSMETLLGKTPAAGEGQMGQRVVSYIRNASTPLLTWYLLSKALRHKTPDQDPDSKFGQIPFGHHYIDLSPMFPFLRGAKMLGVGGYYDARKAGASPGLAGTYGLEDAANHLAQPLTGSPLLQFGTRALFGAEPHVSLLDREGHENPSLLPATPSWGSDLRHVAMAHLLTALAGTNQIAKRVGEHFGVEAPYEHKRDEDKSHLEKAGESALEMLLPGELKTGSSPQKRAKIIAEQDRTDQQRAIAKLLR